MVWGIASQDRDERVCYIFGHILVLIMNKQFDTFMSRCGDVESAREFLLSAFKISM